MHSSKRWNEQVEKTEEMFSVFSLSIILLASSKKWPFLATRELYKSFCDSVHLLWCSKEDVRKNATYMRPALLCWPSGEKARRSISPKLEGEQGAGRAGDDQVLPGCKE
jgi:hypothetical protein